MRLAGNIEKKNAGNFDVGEITYVINPAAKLGSVGAAPFFVSPWDTVKYVHLRQLSLFLFFSCSLSLSLPRPP